MAGKLAEAAERLREAPGYQGLFANDVHTYAPEEYADEPGLTQSFPVVAPLAQTKRGPQNIRAPHEVYERICENELQDDTWLFRRDRAQAAISHREVIATGLRFRAERAEREAEVSAMKAGESVVAIAKSKDERQRQGEHSVRLMEARLKEVGTVREEVALECAGRIEETRALLAMEQEHTAEVEKLLQKEKEKSAEVWRRVAELEAESKARLAARDEELEAERAVLAKRTEEARVIAEARVREVAERCSAELRQMRDHVAAGQARCQERVDTEILRKAWMESEAERRRGVAAGRLTTEQSCMKQCSIARLTDGSNYVQRVQRREEKTKAFVEEWKDGSVSELLSTATTFTHEAHRRELLSTISVEHAVHTLGQHYATQRQYNPTTDGKISSILHGCLHSGNAQGGQPSPRNLPRPRELPALNAGT
mmetsp:Transcript_133805/g.286177  ORF Transcript_133805/g.286177 Transcript_133805/m.286177 type:complete len:426 (-) Transcript_133805:65-1342(-)